MKKFSVKILSLICVILLLMALPIGGIIYRTEYAKTEILTSASEDGHHSLVIYMIGEPDWPFGPTHCRFELMRDSKRIIRYPFSIRDDGAMASENNFSVAWNNTGVTITVTGEEQEEQNYRLNFDGSVE